MGDSDNRHAFGWAPVGARILREYSATAGTVDTAPTVRYAKTWTEIKALPVMQQLLSLAVQQMVLLHAVDTFPRGKMAGLQMPGCSPQPYHFRRKEPREKVTGQTPGTSSTVDLPDPR
jgi:hypothetical protein